MLSPVPSGSIHVRTGQDAVILSCCTRNSRGGEGKNTEQRVPVIWTACHFGGRRPWFICAAHVNSKCCGRRVAVPYLAGDACRKWGDLAYESQRGGPLHATSETRSVSGCGSAVPPAIMPLRLSLDALLSAQTMPIGLEGASQPSRLRSSRRSNFSGVFRGQ